jgi:translation initiation factor 1
VKQRKRNSNSTLVYSSDAGPTCPTCGKATSACSGHRNSATSARGDGVVRVARETKGRKGKGVSVVTGLPLAGDELQKLAKELKARCGAGGTVKVGSIEIQGEHRDTLVQELTARGFQVKRAGG